MMNGTFASMSLTFAPLFTQSSLWALAITAALFLVLSLLFFRRGFLPRLGAMIVLFTLLLNPVLVEQDRVPVKDVAVIVTDRSPSQNIGARTEQADEALLALTENIGAQESLELRTIEAPRESGSVINETRLFTGLDTILADVPEGRRAGVIFITDGQVHDIPDDQTRIAEYGPLHVLLTGERDQIDRRLVITKAPAYGIVGQTVALSFKVEGQENANDDFARITIRENDKAPRRMLVPLNEEQTINVQIDRAGQNIIELETEAVENELTIANNRIPVIINGVRDRLKVLLVSGQPHAGGRTWRNILTADPGVDLVHFTILREPNKLDFTPQNELSLIAFPFRELFEIKLYDFDLIIFDRYRLNRILPMHYFDNIANYVREGGALLEVSGPSYATQNSLFTTALQDILPAYPSGNVLNQEYTPELTRVGKIHPVTTNLISGTTREKPWGPWFRQVAVNVDEGDILMNGINNVPLLALNRVGDGRIAQFSSDQIWLWARGYEGGGPQSQLLRRLIHWLMKEPQLEENALRTSIKDNNITISRNTLATEPLDVEVESPMGEKQTVTLEEHSTGILKGSYRADTPGVYKITDDIQSRFVIVGDPAPPEFMNIHTSAAPFEQAVRETKGSIRWLADNPSLKIRTLQPDRNYSDGNTIALRSNRSFDVKGVRERPLLPPWLALLLASCIILGGWWLEGRNRRGNV